MSHDRPLVDDRPPADAIADMVEHVLALAETWTAWDGEPLHAGDRLYTPHKAIRRVGDHMIDHLAQLEVHLANQTPLSDQWHASLMTTAMDMAPFTTQDLDEARSRLMRLAQIWAIRVRSVPEEELDRSEGDAYTPREMAFCAVGSVYYADSVGRLPTHGRP
jgi:hypothetical protein